MSESRIAMLVALFLAEKTAIFFAAKNAAFKTSGIVGSDEIPLHTHHLHLTLNFLRYSLRYFLCIVAKIIALFTARIYYMRKSRKKERNAVF